MSNKGFRAAQYRRDAKGRFISKKKKKPGLFQRLFKRK